MQPPYFYIAALPPGAVTVLLDETNSRHAVQVLRMRDGDPLQLTDGHHHLFDAVITHAHKKSCEVRIVHTHIIPAHAPEVHIAIAPVKNSSRFEWFLEKAAEIGATAVWPLLTARTEKGNFKTERWQNILISAMLQSRQAQLLQLHEPVTLAKLFTTGTYQRCSKKYIAHCIENTAKQKLQAAAAPSIILIGPEGDFTPDEVDMALAQGCTPVTLGHTRLRTETAGTVSAAILRAG